MAMSSDSSTFSSTAMGLPESSRMRESWLMARFSSRCDSIIGGKSEVPQNFLGSRRLGKKLWNDEVARFDRSTPEERIKRVAVIRAVGTVFSESGPAKQKAGGRQWLG